MYAIFMQKLIERENIIGPELDGILSETRKGPIVIYMAIASIIGNNAILRSYIALYLRTKHWFIISCMGFRIQKDFFIYCIFGAMATLVNMLSYEVFYSFLRLPNTPSVALAWFLAVTFAFFTNKYIVFRSKGKENIHSLPVQLLSFYLCRAASGVLDIIIMFIAVDIFSWNHTLWKFISNLAMGICNYIAGKIFIFKTS